MIKVDVFIKNKNWKKKISNPNKYLNSRVKYLKSSISFLKNKNINFSLQLAGNKEIKLLNKKFRKKNKTTDILSFPFYKKKELKKKLKLEKQIYLGDIIINFNKVKNKSIKNNFKIEFDRLWIHGLVHLFGHDHKKDKDFKRMQIIEKKYFDLLND